MPRCLLAARHVRLHMIERVVELPAQVRHCCDRRNGDESCDEAIFDGGGALLVGR
jgi:hypothetical protein